MSDTTTLPACCQAALRYASRGWHVLPLAPGGKHPLTPNGVHDATVDEAVIRAWWRDNPTANVGVATGASGLIVVDCDVKTSDGVAVFADWCDANDVPYTTLPMVVTPSGGCHYYTRGPRDVVLRPRVGVLAGVDIRAGASYVVAPPSRCDAGSWTWCEEVEVPLAPPAVVELASSTPAVTPTEAAAGRVPEGARNSALTSVAGALRRYGASEAVIEQALAAVAPVACERGRHPLTAREVEGVARSIARYTPATLRPATLTPLDTMEARNTLLAQPDGYTLGWGLDVVLTPGSISYVVGRPGCGKTTLLVNLALEAASLGGWGVAFISLEVTRLDLTIKALTMLQSSKKPLSYHDVKKALRDNPTTLHDACHRLDALAVRAATPEGATANDIVAYIEEVAASTAPPLIIIDYVQLVRSDRRHEARYLDLAAVSHTLLDAAKRYGAIIVAGCQARRAVGDERPPRLSDLREAGDLEQDAAVVIGLHPGDWGTLRVEVLKNRYGALTTVDVAWDKVTGVLSEA